MFCSTSFFTWQAWITTYRHQAGTKTHTSMVNIELVSAKGEGDDHAISTDGVGRQSKMFLGQEVFVDAAMELRVQRAQRGIFTFALFAMLCYIVDNSGNSVWFTITTIVFSGLVFLCFGILLYKNFSFAMMKRLCKELNVVTIIVLSLCNLAIEIIRPVNPIGPIFGLIYALCAACFVLMDAVILKSRYLLIGTGFLFVGLNCYHLYRLTLAEASIGVVLFEYTVYGKGYTIMRRSTQRSIFLQVLLFSVKGIYIMILDKPMKLMVFATANIYKSTGKASEEIHRVAVLALKKEDARAR